MTDGTFVSPYPVEEQVVSDAFDVIGKGGATIRALTDETGCQINIEEDGTITIAATDAAKAVAGAASAAADAVKK